MTYQEELTLSMERKMNRIQEAQLRSVTSALLVILLDSRTGAWLQANDPQAYKQALSSIPIHAMSSEQATDIGQLLRR